MIGSAVDRGDLVMVQHLCEHHGCRLSDLHLFKRALDRDHREVMEYLLEHCPHLVQLQDVKLALLRKGISHIGSVRESKGFVIVVDELVAQELAASDDKMEVLRYLCKHEMLPSTTRISIAVFAGSGRLDLIRMLDTQGAAVASTEAMDRAAENNHWDIVKYLHEHRTEGCTTRVMDAAAAQGRFDYFKYLHRHRSEGFSSRALELAAATGKIGFVRYILQLSDHDGCTTRAMAAAAQKGHLEIVKLLHESQSPSCTTTTIDDGVCQTHQPPQITLGRTAFSPHPFKPVIENDHVDVVRFLYEHYPTRFTPALLHSLLLHGAFDVWMQMRELYPEEANTVVGPVLYAAEKQLRLKTIRFIVNELGREDLAFRAVDGAAEFHSACDARWLRAVIAVTGPQSCHPSAVTAAFSSSNGRVNLANLKFLLSQCSDDTMQSVSR